MLSSVQRSSYNYPQKTNLGFGAKPSVRTIAHDLTERACDRVKKISAGNGKWRILAFASAFGVLTAGITSFISSRRAEALQEEVEECVKKGGIFVHEDGSPEKIIETCVYPALKKVAKQSR